MKKIRDFSGLIEQYNSFLLIAHEQPDGDAVGSLLAMYEYIDGRGKKALPVSKTDVPELFNFLKHCEKIEHDFKIADFDAIILLDNGDMKRTGFANRITEAKKSGVPIINIDHHISNDVWKVATANFADVTASSTSEIVYNFLSSSDAQISPAMATALLTGMYYDTGGFHHSNTSDEVLKISSELLHLGANLKKISKSISQNRSVNMLKLWGIALDRITFDKSKKLAISFLTQKDIESVGANEDEISGLVNLMNTAEEIKVALLLYETADGKIRGSLRTEDDNIDVAKIAELMGGGGHKKASGFSLNGKFVRSVNGWRVT